MFQYRHKDTGVIINTPARVESPNWLEVVPEKTAPKTPAKKKTTTRKKVQKDGDDVHND